ncbi:MAG: patatin-like phospholipase family protein [Candidatus Omnitrophica bacterium]|nr:patatin-like phospholipase family protein [Candidatus Omnitrophota bacterium]
MSEIRYMAGMQDSELRKNAVKSFLEENKDDYSVNSEGKRVYPMLSISGGAANGAYGAGLLKGWSEEGSRPKFKAVTGVSTGAIIAPLVFLGKDYDGMVEEIYTTMSTKDVMKMRRPLKAVFGDSFASNKPLEKQLQKYVTADILKKIADEHRHGRRLYVGTTYLDAQRFVVWDMGAIACRGDIELFRKVILASAAIPMMFPPVFIKVEAGGISYDEMHVDGGTITQVFTLYKVLEGQEDVARDMGIDPTKAKGDYYIIRNGYVNPGYKVVKDSLSAIVSQSLDTMINAQGVGDTYRIYTYMQDRGNDYNLAFIPGDFRPEKKEEFDLAQMKELFDRGYQDAVHGYKWHKVPPGMRSKEEEAAK